MSEVARRKFKAQRLDREGAVRDESGFVLVTAVLLLAVLTVATGAIAISALHVNTQSTRQTSAVRAATAADAGAQVALFRLNTPGGPTGATGATGTMGNGATYTYAVSAPLAQANACAGLWVQNNAQTLSQTCITSTGTVAGVSQRVQERVVAYPAALTFPVQGLAAINGFSSAGTVSGSFDLASDGAVNVHTVSLTGGHSLFYESGKINNNGVTCSVCVAQTTPVRTPVSIPASDNAAAYAAARAAGGNNNAAITGWGTLVYSGSPGYTVKNPNGMNNASLTFPAGTYYFCDADFGPGATITTTGPVKIYVDSSSTYDSGSVCAAGGGGFGGANSFTLSAFAGNPSNLQLYFYGQPPCTNACPNTFTAASWNNQTYTADIFAPYSSDNPAGGTFTMTGAMMIGAMTANGAVTFTYQAPTGSAAGTATATYYPSAHTNCIPSTTPGGTTGPC